MDKNPSNPASTEEALVFKYRNWEGKVGIRHVRPIKIWFGSTEWHEGRHWFLKAHDLDKDAERDFALEDILEFYGVRPEEKSDENTENKVI